MFEIQEIKIRFEIIVLVEAYNGAQYSGPVSNVTRKTSNMELQFVIGVPWWQNFGETHLRSSVELSSEHGI